jgi:hypothetical protein
MSYPRLLKSYNLLVDPFITDNYFLAHYDSNFNDSVSGQVGTVAGTPTPTLGAPAIFGNAVQFGGSTGRVSYPGTGSSGLWSGDFTFECRLRAAAIGGGVNRFLLGSDLVSGSYFCTINTGAATGVLSVSFRGNSLNTGFIPVVDTWYAFAVCVNALNVANGLKVFIDGNIVAQAVPPVVGVSSAALFRIGNDANQNQGWNGQVDEVRITRALRYSANYIPAVTPFP